ncbi:aldo/keto reductase [Luteimicrobium xylanilyticum]|uniref:2,5-didehydrogluconate reductase (2-dehydro-L-gulonate-forming) n=1 Tax=Luteimicrobium xylanilyticum TaxID=1133546 RepID=A0A5P9QF94_9MICO|nr:aldo/keto reductase [Luteimicrobium xylanilyticum]QFV00078.1 2,5-didehydrogluconate reductase (2-dehydro-L-gulonate-forming) [Luteimicrobium xylanilyticum]
MSTMPHVSLAGRTAMPQLGFGVFQVPDDETTAAVSAALETGYRSVDTAAIYGNERGVGRALAASGLPRDEVFVTSKLWVDDLGPGQVRPAYEATLERLGLDALDLYLIHWPAPGRGEYVGAWEQLLELRDAGLVREVGVSNFEPAHLDALLAATGELPPINQVELHPALQQRALRAYHQEHSILTEAWSPLAQGAVLDDPAVARIAVAHDVTPAQVVLRWHLQSGNVVIPKSVTPARIVANLDVLGFELTPDELAVVDALDAGDRTGPHPDAFNG